MQDDTPASCLGVSPPCRRPCVSRVRRRQCTNACTNAHIHASVYVRLHRQTGACKRTEGYTNAYHLESSMERSFEALPASTRDAWSSTRWPTCVEASHVRIFWGDGLQVSTKRPIQTDSRACSRCWKRWALTESGTPSFSRIAITNGFRGCPGAVKALVSYILSQWASGSHSRPQIRTDHGGRICCRFGGFIHGLGKEGQCA